MDALTSDTAVRAPGVLTPDGVDHLCREAVRSLASSGGYPLWDEADVWEEVLHRAKAALTEAGVSSSSLPASDLLADSARALARRAALQVYGAALYRRCVSTVSQDVDKGYRALGAYLWGVAWRAVRERPGKEEAIKDCVQDALAGIHRSIRMVKSPEAFLFYAKRVVTNALAKHLSEADVRRAHEVSPTWRSGDGDELDVVDQLAAGDRTPEDAALEAEARLLAVASLDCLAEALARLEDSRLRQVLLLRFFAGWDRQRVATRLGLTANHVGVLQNRAIARMQRDSALTECIEATM